MKKLKKKILYSFLKNDFTRNSYTLITGTIIAQIVPILFTPILSRLYNSNDFAVFGLFYSLAGIIASISAGTYEFAIVLPKRETDAGNLMILSVILSFIISVSSLIVFIVFNRFIGELLNNDQISFWLYFVPLSVFIITLNSIFTFWNNRNKMYPNIAFNKILRNGSATGGSIMLGLFKSGSLGLVTGQILGDTVSTVVYYSRIIKDLKWRGNITRDSIKSVASMYRKFPVFTLPSTLLNTLSNQLPIFLISAWFSSELTGAYFFSSRILSIPMAFVGAAVGQIFYQKFAEIVREKRKEAVKFLFKIWTTLFLIGIIPMSILFLFGENLFVFVFGNKWATAGAMSSILAPMILFTFISSPTSSTYLVMDKQNLSIYFSIASLIYRPLALFIGFHTGDIFLGLKFLVFFEILEIFIYNAVILRFMK